MCPVVKSTVYDDNTAEALQGGFKALNLSTVTSEARERERGTVMYVSINFHTFLQFDISVPNNAFNFTK